jgi:hypothetical protein
MAGQRKDDRKVDRAVRESMRAGTATQSVIITVKPGYRDSLRESLLRHGDVIKSEHPLIDAMAVEIHSSDVDELSNQPWVAAVSAPFGKAQSNNDAKNNDSNRTRRPLRATAASGSTLRETSGWPGQRCSSP